MPWSNDDSMRCSSSAGTVNGNANEVGIGPVALGNFVNAVIGFLIKAAVIYFLVVKPFSALIHRLYPPLKPGDPPPSAEVKVLCEIRDLLSVHPPRT